MVHSIKFELHYCGCFEHNCALHLDLSKCGKRMYKRFLCKCFKYMVIFLNVFDTNLEHKDQLISLIQKAQKYGLSSDSSTSLFQFESRGHLQFRTLGVVYNIHTFIAYRFNNLCIQIVSKCGRIYKNIGEMCDTSLEYKDQRISLYS